MKKGVCGAKLGILLFVAVTWVGNLSGQTANTPTHHLAEEAFEAGNMAAAHEQYAKLLSLDASNPLWHARFGAACTYDPASFDLANSHLQRAAKLGIRNTEFHDEWLFFSGKAAHLGYDFQNAADRLSEYLELAKKRDRWRPEAEQRLGQCQAHLEGLRGMQQVEVLEKFEANRDLFFRFFNLQPSAGRLVAVPAELRTKLDEKRGHVGQMQILPNMPFVLFASYGNDGDHGLDIYRAEVQSGGGFSDPVRLPAPVNTAFDETTPTYTPPKAGTPGKLHFASNRPEALGGFDLFDCDYDLTTPPTSLNYVTIRHKDYTVNTTANEWFYMPTGDGKRVWFASDREGDFQALQVYQIREHTTALAPTSLRFDIPANIATAALAQGARLQLFNLTDDASVLSSQLVQGESEITATMLQPIGETKSFEWRWVDHRGQEITSLAPFSPFDIEGKAQGQTVNLTPLDSDLLAVNVEEFTDVSAWSPELLRNHSLIKVTDGVAGIGREELEGRGNEGEPGNEDLLGDEGTRNDERRGGQLVQASEVDTEVEGEKATPGKRGKVAAGGEMEQDEDREMTYPRNQGYDGGIGKDEEAGEPIQTSAVETRVVRDSLSEERGNEGKLGNASGAGETDQAMGMETGVGRETAAAEKRGNKGVPGKDVEAGDTIQVSGEKTEVGGETAVSKDSGNEGVLGNDVQAGETALASEVETGLGGETANAEERGTDEALGNEARARQALQERGATDTDEGETAAINRGNEEVLGNDVEAGETGLASGLDTEVDGETAVSKDRENEGVLGNHVHVGEAVLASGLETGLGGETATAEERETNGSLENEARAGQTIQARGATAKEEGETAASMDRGNEGMLGNDVEEGEAGLASGLETEVGGETAATEERGNEGAIGNNARAEQTILARGAIVIDEGETAASINRGNEGMPGNNLERGEAALASGLEKELGGETASAEERGNEGVLGNDVEAGETVLASAVETEVDGETAPAEERGKEGVLGNDVKAGETVLASAVETEIGGETAADEERGTGGALGNEARAGQAVQARGATAADKGETADSMGRGNEEMPGNDVKAGETGLASGLETEVDGETAPDEERGNEGVLGNDVKAGETVLARAVETEVGGETAADEERGTGGALGSEARAGQAVQARGTTAKDKGETAESMGRGNEGVQGNDVEAGEIVQGSVEAGEVGGETAVSKERGNEGGIGNDVEAGETVQTNAVETEVEGETAASMDRGNEGVLGNDVEAGETGQASEEETEVGGKTATARERGTDRALGNEARAEQAVQERETTSTDDGETATAEERGNEGALGNDMEAGEIVLASWEELEAGGKTANAEERGNDGALGNGARAGQAVKAREAIATDAGNATRTAERGNDEEAGETGQASGVDNEVDGEMAIGGKGSNDVEDEETLWTDEMGEGNARKRPNPGGQGNDLAQDNEPDNQGGRKSRRERERERRATEAEEVRNSESDSAERNPKEREGENAMEVDRTEKGKAEVAVVGDAADARAEVEAMSEAAQAFLASTFVLEAATVEAGEPIAEVASKDIFPSDQTVYSVQVGAFRNRPEARYFGSFSPVIAVPLPSGVARYLTGIFKDYETAAEARDAIRRIGGFEDAFVVVYQDGERVPLLPRVATDAEAGGQNDGPSDVLPAEEGIGGVEWSAVSGVWFSIQIGAFQGYPTSNLVESLCPCNREMLDGRLTRWTSGKYENLPSALADLEIIRSSLVPDAFVVAFSDGRRIKIADAIRLRMENLQEEADEKVTTYRIRVVRFGDKTPAADAAKLLRLSEFVPMQAVVAGEWTTYYSLPYVERGVAELAAERCQQAGFDAVLQEMRQE